MWELEMTMLEQSWTKWVVKVFAVSWHSRASTVPPWVDKAPNPSMLNPFERMIDSIDWTLHWCQMSTSTAHSCGTDAVHVQTNTPNRTLWPPMPVRKRWKRWSLFGSIALDILWSLDFDATTVWRLLRGTCPIPWWCFAPLDWSSPPIDRQWCWHCCTKSLPSRKLPNPANKIISIFHSIFNLAYECGEMVMIAILVHLHLKNLKQKQVNNKLKWKLQNTLPQWKKQVNSLVWYRRSWCRFPDPSGRPAFPWNDPTSSYDKWTGCSWTKATWSTLEDQSMLHGNRVTKDFRI